MQNSVEAKHIRDMQRQTQKAPLYWFPGACDQRLVCVIQVAIISRAMSLRTDGGDQLILTGRSPSPGKRGTKITNKIAACLNWQVFFELIKCMKVHQIDPMIDSTRRLRRGEDRKSEDGTQGPSSANLASP